MEVETALQALQELLDSDLRRRQRELQESLTVLEVETDECVLTCPAVISLCRFAMRMNSVNEVTHTIDALKTAITNA